MSKLEWQNTDTDTYSVKYGIYTATVKLVESCGTMQKWNWEISTPTRVIKKNWSAYRYRSMERAGALFKLLTGEKISGYKFP